MDTIIVSAVLCGIFFGFIASYFPAKTRIEKINKEHLGFRTNSDREKSALEVRLQKYSSLISYESEVNRLKLVSEDLSENIKSTKADYAEKRKILERLESQIAIFDDRIAFAELGVYEPHFDFKDSEQFKAEINGVRALQKSLISTKLAVLCDTAWAVEGSKSKGQTMINRQSRLTLRAFNSECDAAISNAKWNNVVAMEKRIINAAEQINKENASLDMRVNQDFLQLKLKELELTHEYREKQKSEKEERLEMARAEREEKKLLATAEAAEKDELKYKALLEKAKAEAGASVNGLTTALSKRIADLEKQIALAHEESERARAMAEITKSGYVYIISNVGSFGEDVVKIGLTRRLDPDDRVRELGDASVPFTFDTHAMIYSNDAPALEKALHKEFSERRVNISNHRKEFFRVGLDEVELALKKISPDAPFFKDREAQEWHETLARRNQYLKDMQKVSDSFPQSI